MKTKAVMPLVAIAILQATFSPHVFANDKLDFSRPEFKVTWRKKGTEDKISFIESKSRFAVEFSGSNRNANTSDASYSHCDAGRDGGANLCVSGPVFECAYFVTMSSNKIANLGFRRGNVGYPYCQALQGDYDILMD